MKKFIFILLALISINSFAQKAINCTEIQPDEEYENIHVKRIDGDDNKTSFIIWVKKEVKAHKHEKHTETLYVLEGEGEMTIGDNTFKIKEGDYINIPLGSVHSVNKVTSEKPLKVISVQAPEFLGEDRVFVE